MTPPANSPPAAGGTAGPTTAGATNPAGLSAVSAQREKVEMFIDGTNLHNSLAEAGYTYDIDIPQFARRLAGLKGEYMFVKAHYCTAPFLFRHTEAFRRQQRLFDKLREAKSVELVLGHHIRLPDGRHVEKETDANVVVRMLTGAYEGRYDVALLVSADTDMVPAVKAVQALGKRVIWVHFNHQAHSDLATLCDDTHCPSSTFLEQCRVWVPRR